MRTPKVHSSSQDNIYVSVTSSRSPCIGASLNLHYILESTFARIFLFLELIHQQETHIYINLNNFHILVLLFLSSYNNNFILIGHSRECVQSRRTCDVLKIERYAQKLSHRAGMGEESSF